MDFYLLQNKRPSRPDLLSSHRLAVAVRCFFLAFLRSAFFGFFLASDDSLLPFVLRFLSTALAFAAFFSDAFGPFAGVPDAGAEDADADCFWAAAAAPPIPPCSTGSPPSTSDPS